MEWLRLLLEHLAWIEHQFLTGIRDPRQSVRDDERCGRSREVNTPVLIGLGLGLESLCWSFKAVQEEIPFEEASGIYSMTMHQSSTPSLSQTIWLSLASRQFLSFPIVQTLLLVTFAYSLSSEAVVMRQLRRWKRLWGRSLTRSHKRTSMGLPEAVGTVQQVHCRRLLRRGREFYVCIINKSDHTKKSWNLFNDPRISEELKTSVMQLKTYFESHVIILSTTNKKNQFDII